MEYRGVQFTVTRLKRAWQWTTSVGEPAMYRIGESDTEQTAIMEVRRVIDRALRVSDAIQSRRDS